MADGLAVTIPAKGMPLRDSDPSPVEVYRCVVSGDTTATQYDVRVGAGDSAGVVPVFYVPDNTYILDVGWKVRTAFTAAVDIAIGDSDDADGWGDSTDLGATTVDTDINWAGNEFLKELSAYSLAGDTTVAEVGVPAYAKAGGRYVGPSSDHGATKDAFPVNLTFGGAATAIAAGLLDVYIKVFRAWDRDFKDRRG